MAFQTLENTPLSNKGIYFERLIPKRGFFNVGLMMVNVIK